ncbi:MAG: hypothetical protein AB1349_04015 [Elusimicrobiota bacterium]
MKNLKKLFTIHYSLFTASNGSALVFAMVAILFLAGVGLTFIFWLSSESRQTGKRQAVTKDYYIAEAGTEKALLDVKNTGYTWQKGTSTQQTYIINGESVTVTVTNVGEE